MDPNMPRRRPVDPDTTRRMMENLAQQRERLARPLRGVSIGQLRGLSEAELIEKHDELVAEASSANDPEQMMRILDRAQAYADELARREYARQGERMETLTRSMYVLSAVGVLVAIVGVILAAMTLLSG